MKKEGVKVMRSLSTCDLNGTRMKMKLIIDCSYPYKTNDGKNMTEEIFKTIETIMDRYAEKANIKQ